MDNSISLVGKLARCVTRILNSLKIYPIWLFFTIRVFAYVNYTPTIIREQKLLEDSFGRRHFYIYTASRIFKLSKICRKIIPSMIFFSFYVWFPIRKLTQDWKVVENSFWCQNIFSSKTKKLYFVGFLDLELVLENSKKNQIVKWELMIKSWNSTHVFVLRNCASLCKVLNFSNSNRLTKKSPKLSESVQFLLIS